MARRLPQTISAIAEIDRRQVARQYLVLAQPGVEPDCEHHLLQLAADLAIRRQESGLGKLLGDRRSALDHAARPRVAPEGPDQPAWVDAIMRGETPVLDRDERPAHLERQAPRIDRSITPAGPGDRRAIGGKEGEVRLFGRLHRAPGRRDPRRPGDRGQQQHGQHHRHPFRDPAPRQAFPPGPAWGCLLAALRVGRGATLQGKPRDHRSETSLCRRRSAAAPCCTARWAS